MSDLHLEFHRDDGAAFLDSLDPSGVDLLILAGDIIPLARPAQSAHTLQRFCQLYPRVFYLPGNHEYYHSSWSGAEATRQWIERQTPTLTVFRPGDLVLHEGRRFLGATQWFPDQEDNPRYFEYMSDFQVIADLVPACYEHFAHFESFLQQEMRPGDIVLTHHLPTWKSVAWQYERSPLNRFFVGDLEYLIRDVKPALWVHGHCHQSWDYTLEETRILCNPHGYPDEAQIERFNPRLMLNL